MINGCMHREPPCLTPYMVQLTRRVKSERRDQKGKGKKRSSDLSEWLLVIPIVLKHRAHYQHPRSAVPDRPTIAVQMTSKPQE